MLGCWSMFASAPPPQRPSWSGGWGDCGLGTPERLTTWVAERWQKFLKVVVGYGLEKEYKQSIRYSYSKIAEIKTRK